MRSPSSSSSSSSSSYETQYYSAIPSPSTREFSHDGFTSVSLEDIRMNSTPQQPPLPPPPPSSSSFSSCWSSSIASSRSTSQTSSANPSPSTSHDVFISFRGDDTRYGFVSHLCAAFTRHRIRAYMDCNLERGNEISSTLLVAIEQSKISLIVFSKRYADSTWTLSELAKIMECKTTRGQYVIPIFYKVQPSDVRHHRGNYEAEFRKHKRASKVNNDTVQQWMAAMTKAANLSGWTFSDDRSEADLVEEIAIDIIGKLEMMSRGIIEVAATEQQEQGASLSSPSGDPNSGDSQQDLSFPNKCLSNRGNILGNLLDAFRLKDNERLVLTGGEGPHHHEEASTSASQTPKTTMYRYDSVCVFLFSRPTLISFLSLQIKLSLAFCLL